MIDDFSLDDSEIDPDYEMPEPEMPAWQKKKIYDALCERFASMTKNFDLDDWRDMRTENYWKSDHIEDKIKKMQYKLHLVEYYRAKGKPLA